LPPRLDSVDGILEGLIVPEALEPAHREVMTLVHEEDLPQSQIAERRAVPPGTVKTPMFHGMRALRTALAERGFDAA
jgi:RNA polymerase sigma-70 factor, ECF subfamily